MLSVYVKSALDLEDLPDTDLYVVFDNNFDEPVVIPSRTKELKLGIDYTNDLDLPEGLTHLTVNAGKYEYVLPNSLLYLRIRYNKKFKIDNLPPKLSHLILPDEWNKPLNNLPISLLYLEIGNYSSVSLDNLPYNLEKLVLGKSFKGKINNLPHSLKEIYYKGNIQLNKIPFGCILKKIN